MPRTSRSKAELYLRELRKLMVFVQGRHVPFPVDHVFTRDELLEVTPEKIVEYLKLQVYGTADARPDVDPPLHHRANTVLYMKKAWSYYMPNKGMPWNDVARTGNPTRSYLIHELIGNMKRMEAARRGVPTQARRALRAPEYENTIETFTEDSNKEVGMFLSSFFSFQVHLIGRLDDTAKFRQPDLQPFVQYPDFGISVKLCWSKNVREERDVPTQVIFGAQDWRYCALSNLAAWLEYHWTLNPEENDFFFGVGGETSPESIKATASYHLRRLLNSDTFVLAAEGETGTHSLRKFAVNIARRSGCSKDDTDQRARWKGRGRQQDAYADTTIPYVDAKVAAALCKGGAITYQVKPESGIDDTWVLDYVVPAVKEKLPRQAAIVLGRALLWKCFHDVSGEHLPAQIRGRVFRAYNDLDARNSLEAGDNPVAKVPIGVAGVDAELIIDEIMGGGGEGGEGHDARVLQGMGRQEVRILSSQVQHLRRELADTRAEAERRDVQMKHTLTRINRNVARLAATPGRSRVANGPVGEADAGAGATSGDGSEEGGVEAQPGAPGVPAQPPRRVASLMARPRTLHLLWHEYEHGGNGRKAAKDFTLSERGAVKSQYNTRLQFWRKCEEMIRSGMTADVACDRIYQAYGRGTSVTTILRNMRRDKRTGWPPVMQTLNL